MNNKRAENKGPTSPKFFPQNWGKIVLRIPICFVTLILAILHVAAPPRTLANNQSTERNPSTNPWPPSWLSGLWENQETTVTLNGQPTNKSFLCGSHYLFLSGMRFSVYKGKRIRATPMMGHTNQDDVDHCLFKMTKQRAAMRAEFSGNGSQAQYVSYLFYAGDGKRYKFQRRLARVGDEAEALKIIKSTLDREFISPHSESAREILQKWIDEKERAIAQKKTRS